MQISTLAPVAVETIRKTKNQALVTSPKFWLNVGSAIVALATWFLAHPGMGFVPPDVERQVFYWLGLVVAIGNAVHQYVYSADHHVAVKVTMEERHEDLVS